MWVVIWSYLSTSGAHTIDPNARTDYQTVYRYAVCWKLQLRGISDLPTKNGLIQGEQAWMTDFLIECKIFHAPYIIISSFSTNVSAVQGSSSTGRSPHREIGGRCLRGTRSLAGYGVTVALLGSKGNAWFVCVTYITLAL